MAAERKTQEAYGEHMFDAGAYWAGNAQTLLLDGRVSVVSQDDAIRLAQQEWSRMGEGADDGDDREHDRELQEVDRPPSEA